MYARYRLFNELIDTTQLNCDKKFKKARINQFPIFAKTYQKTLQSNQQLIFFEEFCFAYAYSKWFADLGARKDLSFDEYLQKDPKRPQLSILLQKKC